MSGDDWHAGDDALCVRTDSSGTLVVGRVYKVRRVLRYGDPGTQIWERGMVGLWVGVEPSPIHSWCSSRFRKIRPHVPDAEDRETIALLTGKPAKVRTEPVGGIAFCETCALWLLPTEGCLHIPQSSDNLGSDKTDGFGAIAAGEHGEDLPDA